MKTITLINHKNNIVVKKSFLADFKSQWRLQVMVIPAIIFMLVFNYIPMIYVVSAFQDFNIVKGIFHSPFVGFAQFNEMFADNMFWTSLLNSFGMSIVKLIITFPLPIIFAVMLTEINNKLFKKFSQTLSYLPHFISWVVVAGLFQIWLDSNGIINEILTKINLIQSPILFLQSKNLFWILMALIDAWKETGWWAIIFLASIASIPPELYESAVVDGAGRIRKIISITIPSIKSTIIVVFILTMGSILSGGLSSSNFSQSYLFGNVLNYDYSQILDIYIARLGLEQGRYSFAAAGGLILSVLSVVSFSLTNMIFRKMGETSLY